MEQELKKRKIRKRRMIILDGGRHLKGGPGVTARCASPSLMCSFLCDLNDTLRKRLTLNRLQWVKDGGKKDFCVTGESLGTSCSSSDWEIKSVWYECPSPPPCLPINMHRHDLFVNCWLWPWPDAASVGEGCLRARGVQPSEARLQKYRWHWSQHERSSVHQTVVFGE